MSNTSNIIVARNSASGGARMTGLTPTWTHLKKLNDLTNISPQPTFTEAGNGEYGFLYDPQFYGDAAGQVDLGATLTTEADRYIDVLLLANVLSPAYTLICARDSTQSGKRITGLTPSWTQLRYLIGGGNAVQPSITEVAHGQYAFPYDALGGGEVVGQVDLGSALANAADRYVDVLVGLNTVVPPVLVGTFVFLMPNVSTGYRMKDGTYYVSDNAGHVYAQSYHVPELGAAGGQRLD